LKGYEDERKFIATQEPALSSFNDFWTMTWQQSSLIIIMLTQVKENKTYFFIKMLRLFYAFVSITKHVLKGAD